MASSSSTSSWSLGSNRSKSPDHRRRGIPIQNFSNTLISKSNPPYLPQRAQPRDTTVQWIADAVSGNEKYRVTIHIDGFYPNEIHSRVDGNRLFIHGEHVENKSQGMCRRLLEKSYELPSDVDQYRPHVTFPTSTLMQVDFPARHIDRVVQRSSNPPRYSKPRLIHTSEYVTRKEPTVRTTYVQRSNKVDSHPRSIHRVSFDSTDSSMSTRRFDSPVLSKISHPVRVRSMVSFRDRSRTPPLSFDHQRSLLPLDFNAEQFYRSEFRPQIVTDRQHEHHIKMKLDLEQHNPDDLQVFIDGTDLTVQIAHTEFYQQITLPSNTDFSTITIQPHADGQLHITAKLRDKYSSAVYI